MPEATGGKGATVLGESSDYTKLDCMFVLIILFAYLRIDGYGNIEYAVMCYEYFAVWHCVVM